ncbi:MAG: glycosyltransferase family 2 protein [Bacteroidales bacterium]|nr:glycosyltransferase family 2 protein [Bacteroidales bacterium]
MNGTFENSTFSLDNNICVLIPVYNSGALIQNVIASLLAKKVNILVVNDGSTDNTENFIKEFLPKIHYISYPINKGKGYALQQGFAEALRLGYRFAITMDADGQHKAEDLIYFAEQFSSTPNAILLGVRNFNQENMSSSSRFANKFSNFWFMLQTALKISDTQTGYRMYPLQQIKNIHLLTQGYATELELLVKARWRNISIKEVPINVYYPPRNERVSHFRPGKDFLKISLLNTYLCVLAIIYGYPSLLLRKIGKTIHKA